MEQLWSPWRLAYVSGGGGDGDACVFCKALDDTDEPSLLIHRGQHSFVVLNKFPYNNGHLMVVPVRHIAALSETTEAELAELALLTRTAEMALTEAYAPDGINVGINLGRPAGAGIVGHLHVHLVPRWQGDTNFMTVVGETRVVPEAPAETVNRLRPVFARLTG